MFHQVLHYLYTNKTPECSSLFYIISLDLLIFRTKNYIL